MRKTLCLAAAVALVLAAKAARADEKADARAVIDKAVMAAGGADKLAAIKAETFKGKGKFYGLGEGLDYTGEWAIQRPDKIRFQIEFEANGMKFTFLQVYNGKVGWTKINDATMEMDKDAVEEVKEQTYAGRVEALEPLVKDKGFELSPLGEVKVGDGGAVGVRVSHKGHRDINLFFDKKSGLLLKSERTVKDPMMGGKELAQVTLFSDYKDVDGVKQAMKVAIKRDGKDYVEMEVSDLERKDKLDDSVFAKP
jgi:hypothetical protein